MVPMFEEGLRVSFSLMCGVNPLHRLDLCRVLLTIPFSLHRSSRRRASQEIKKEEKEGSCLEKVIERQKFQTG